MWMPTDSRKGEDDHCWMKASHCLSTPSEPPLRLSYWIFRVSTISLHISCINIVGCTVWLEKSRRHRCFHRIQRVIGLTNSNTTWDLSLRGVVDIADGGKKTSWAFIIKVITKVRILNLFIEPMLEYKLILVLKQAKTKVTFCVNEFG